MRKVVLIILAALLPLIAVSIYAVTRPSSKPAVKKHTQTTATPAPAKKHKQPLTDEQFLNLPGSGGVPDSSGTKLVKPSQPAVKLPEVGGIKVTGGFDWSDRSAILRNTAAFASDLAHVDVRKPQATFAHMSTYMAAGALETAKSLVDPSAAGSAHARPKASLLFLYADPQTNGQVGKLIYDDKTYLSMEYAPDGKILLIRL